MSTARKVRLVLSGALVAALAMIGGGLIAAAPSMAATVTIPSSLTFSVSATSLTLTGGPPSYDSPHYQYIVETNDIKGYTVTAQAPDFQGAGSDAIGINYLSEFYGVNGGPASKQVTFIEGSPVTIGSSNTTTASDVYDAYLELTPPASAPADSYETGVQLTATGN
jgi:hypothetical protein